MKRVAYEFSAFNEQGMLCTYAFKSLAAARREVKHLRAEAQRRGRTQHEGHQGLNTLQIQRVTREDMPAVK